VNLYKKINIIFLVATIFVSSEVHAIDINKSMSMRNTYFDLDEVIQLVSVLDEVKKNNSLKFRGNTDNFFSRYADGIVAIFTEDGTGSGAVIDNNGLVVTNWHVVGENTEVSVVFKPTVGSKAVPSAIHKADVILVDKTRDLALLKPLYPPKNITFLEFDSNYKFNDDYLVSQEAHCIGHPEGFTWTYTKGIISQIRSQEQWSYYTDKFSSNLELSESELDKELEASIWHIADVLQIDCSINPGNSGGPIMNSKGELLGINSNFIDGSQTINFAIAAHEVQSLLDGDVTEPMSVKEKDKIVAEFLILEELDYNEDGLIDTLLLDMSGNLIVDAYYIDDDFDKSTGDEYGYDYVLMDQDENDVPEAMIYWEDQTQIEEYDIEQDGVYDILMIDYDQDGEYDLVQRI
jgi:S1-C subfamily serine protease